MKTLLQFTALLCASMMNQPMNAMKRPRRGNSVPQIAPVPLNETLYDAAQNLQGMAAYNIIRTCVAHGADPNTCNHEGDSALHAAASADNFYGAQALVDSNAEINISNAHRMTPLHAAIDTQPEKTKSARWLIIKLLIAHGADKWLTPEYSPLKHAVMHGDHCSAVALLSTLSKNEYGNEESLAHRIERELEELRTELSRTDNKRRTLQQVAQQMNEPDIAALVDPNNTQQFRSMLLGSGI